MAKSQLKVSISSDVKEEAKKLFNDLGLDLSSAIEIFLRQSIRDNGLPFKISRNVPNDIAASKAKEKKKSSGLGHCENVEDLVETLQD